MQFALQVGSLYLWIPVLTGIGICLYFSGALVAPYVVSGVGLCGLGFVYFLGRERLPELFVCLPVRACFLLPAFVLCGLLVSDLRVLSVGSVMLDRDIDYTQVQGEIISLERVDAAGKRLRFLIRPHVIEDLQPDKVPAFVRLSLRSSESVADRYHVGDLISGYGALKAPSGPVLPGEFDFYRYLYFKKIGALGYFYKPPLVQGAAPEARMIGVVEKARSGIVDRLYRAHADAITPVVAALFTGQKSGIADADYEAMRGAGLAHMLAISGLHVGLFAGAVFFVVRLILVMIPGFVLRYDAKKVAAILGLLAAFIYMLLAGATIPTQRAVLMITVVFGAMLIGRSAISMRMVVFAAMVLLLFMPESLLSAGFQLSFAAVSALVLFYESTRLFWKKWARQKGVFTRVGLYLVGIVCSSVIAGFATMPLALFHFKSAALYGVAANLLAMPVLSLLVMPCVVLACFLMPLGLEFIALAPVHYGVGVIVKIGHMVTDWQGSALQVPAFPPAAMGALIISVVLICFVRGWLRCLAILPLGLCFVMLVQFQRPLVLVADQHDLWGYVSEAEGLTVNSKRKAKFVRERWQEYFNHPDLFEFPDFGQVNEGGMRCDQQACRVDIAGKHVSFVSKKEALLQECAWADVVVTYLRVRDACPSEVVIDYAAVRQDGAHALYWHGRGPVQVQTEAKWAWRPRD